MKLQLADNFDAQYSVDAKTGCWLWQRAVGSHGYGMLSVKGKVMLAHRFSYERAHGKIPMGMFACHSCDTRRCVNPKHIWPGTPKDNHDDSAAKGRARKGVHRGENNVTSKLTEKDVRDIRGRVSRGETQTRVALDYRVHKTNVQCICARKTWKHI